jgi:hypothetical protein
MSESFQSRLAAAKRAAEDLMQAVGTVIVGQRDVVEQVLWA